MSILERLETMCKRHGELSALLALPATAADPGRLARYSKELSDLEPVVASMERYHKLQKQLAEAEHLAEAADADADMRELAREERESLRQELTAREKEMKLLLIPPDPHDGKDIILEIRAGTGGEEAALFASELFRMYSRFAETRGWKVEVLSTSVTTLGGTKEIVAAIAGGRVYSVLKFESGVHRVQRVPVTEAGGRIHTSAVTVAVLPEAEEVEVEIHDNDLRIDVYRSSGPGGQSVNTTDSAVRLTHLPSGLVVICQDEKSQHKNKAKAMKVLKARLYDMKRQEADAERARDRRDQVGTGDRSERIRTYNFPQGRVTDHRINLTLHRLNEVLAGDLAELTETLSAHHQAEALARIAEG